MKRSNYELKKQCEWWLTSSHLVVGALAAKLIEGKDQFTIQDSLTIIAGLFVLLICVRVGHYYSKKVKE